MNHEDDSQEFTTDINVSIVKCCHVSIWMLIQSLGTHVPPKSEYINMFSKQGVLKKNIAGIKHGLGGKPGFNISYQILSCHL